MSVQMRAMDTSDMIASGTTFSLRKISQVRDGGECKLPDESFRFAVSKVEVVRS